MTAAECIAWIDQASYEQLLRKWRFAKCGDPLLQGKPGEHFAKVLNEKRKEVGAQEHTNTSKRIGW